MALRVKQFEGFYRSEMTVGLVSRGLLSVRLRQI